jgi:Zn-dependent protease
MHATFLLLLAWVVLSSYLAHGDPAEALGGLVFILALFGIVVLHELGHALTARRYGIRTRDIMLLPIGGVARLERMPDDPRQELVVALAGPAVNIVLAISIYLGLALGQGLIPVDDAMQAGANLLDQLFWVNVSLALFNLLPAFPMDGGRVLRALLAMRMDYVRATRTAAAIGQGMAILFAIAGMFYNPFLVLIGVFVWLGAAQETSLVQFRFALDGVPIQRAMISDFRSLQPNDRLARAAELGLAGFQQDFPVIEDDLPLGVLTRQDLITGLGHDGPDGRVGDAMQRQIAKIDAHEPLQAALARLQQSALPILAVMQNGHVIGLLTADNLAEAILIQEALRSGAFARHRGELPRSAAAHAPHVRSRESSALHRQQ